MLFHNKKAPDENDASIAIVCKAFNDLDEDEDDQLGMFELGGQGLPKNQVYDQN